MKHKILVGFSILFLLLMPLFAEAITFNQGRSISQSLNFNGYNFNNQAELTIPKIHDSPLRFVIIRSVGNAKLGEKFSIEAIAEDNDDYVEALTLGRYPYTSDKFKRIDCKPDSNRCLGVWSIKEDKEGAHTYQIKAKNSKGKITATSLTVFVNSGQKFWLKTAAIDGAEFDSGNLVYLTSKISIADNNRTLATPFAEKAVEANVPMDLQYWASGYESDGDQLFIDSQITGCSGQQCTVQNKDFTTNCNYIAAFHTYDCTVSKPGWGLLKYSYQPFGAGDKHLIRYNNPLYKHNAPIVNFKDLALETSQGADASIKLSDYVSHTDKKTLVWSYSGADNVKVRILDDSTAIITPKDKKFSGTEILTFKATAPNGMSDSDKLSVRFFNTINDAPEFQTLIPSSNTLTLPKNSRQIFTAYATDADKDFILYTWKVDGTVVASDTMTYDYRSIVNSNKNLNHTVEVIASDGENSAKNVWNISVFNRAPSLEPSSLDDRAVNENSLLVGRILASDPDDTSLKFTFTNTPEGFVGNSDGTFKWTPTFEQAGTYTINIEVSDGVLTDNAVFNIIVDDVNRAPIIRSVTGATAIKENEEASFIVDAYDPDGDSISVAVLDDKFTKSGNTFTWKTNYQDEGSYDLRFLVSDGKLSAAKDITFSVADVNTIPSIIAVSASGNSPVQETDNVVITVDATDEDGDALTISSDDSRFTETITGINSRTYTWATGYEDEGSYNFNFKVSDGVNEVNAGVDIVVTKRNRAPTFDTESLSGRVVDENKTLVGEIIASDLDNDEITFTFTNTPEGFVGNNNGTFKWTPTFEQAGTNIVGVEVSDGEESQTASFMISVNDVNRNPTLQPIGDKVMDEDSTLSFVVNAEDADGDTLSYEMLSAVGRLDPTTGLFEYDADFNAQGTYELTFKVSDGRGGSDEESITLIVNNVPQPIEVTSAPLTETLDENPYQYQVSAISRNYDSITYSLSEAPDGMTITPEGLVEWTPALKDIGAHQITILMNDTVIMQEHKYTLEVMPWDTENPVINSLDISPAKISPSTPITFTLDADDNDAIANVSLVVDNGSSETTYKPSESNQDGPYITDVGTLPVGNYAYTVKVYDRHNNFASSSGTFNVKIRPTVQHNSPTDNIIVYNTDGNVSFKYIPYEGSASFTKCDLLADFSGSMQEEASTNDVNGNVENTFNITGLSAGTYHWQVLCTDANSETADDAERTFEVRKSITIPQDETITSMKITGPKLVENGTTAQYNAALQLSGGLTVNAPASWSSSNTTTATIDNTGLVSAAELGTTDITANFESLTDKVAILVVPQGAALTALNITPENATIFMRDSQAYTATATYDDGTLQDVTAFTDWSSSNEVVASMNFNTATGFTPGNATISASFTYGTTTANANTNLEVIIKPPQMTGLTITPVNVVERLGHTIQFTATASYDDGTSQNVSASWNSDNETVATINTNGLADTLALGSATINASYNGFEDSTTLSILPLQVIVTSDVDNHTVNQFEETDYTITIFNNQSFSATYDISVTSDNGVEANVTNKTVTLNGLESKDITLNVKGLVGGTSNTTVIATDDSDATSYDSTTITTTVVDNVAPTVTINMPTTATYNNPLLTLDFNITETATCTYNITGPTTIDADINPCALQNSVALPFLADGSYTLTVNAKDMFNNEGSSSVTFTVNTQSQILGVVTNGSLPLENVTVELLDGSNIVGITKTDASGMYRLNANQGTYTIKALLDGYETYADSVSIGSDASEYDIVLTQKLSSSIVSGTVSDTDNKLYNTVVQLEYDNVPIYVATTGTDGKYTFSGVVPRTYTLTAIKSGYIKSSTSLTVNQAAQTQDIVLTAATAGSISGTVYNSTFSTVANATVRIFDAGTNNLVQVVASDSNGIYKVNGLLGVYDINATQADYPNTLFGQEGVIVSQLPVSGADIVLG